MIFLLLLFVNNDNLRQNFKEGFFGCNRVPGTAKYDYQGPYLNNYVDKMCSDKSEDAPYNEDKKWLKWPCYWRSNYSKPLPEDIGGEGLYKEMKNVGYHEPFKFDGVWSLGETGDKCNWS